MDYEENPILQKHLERMKTNNPNRQGTDIDPMYGLQYLRSIQEEMPSFEELRAEYLQERYGV